MSRTQAHGFRVGKLAAVRTEGVIYSYWIEQRLGDDWIVVEHCDDWHDAITKLERWQFSNEESK